jgi:Tfp pilus assembly protein PilO
MSPRPGRKRFDVRQNLWPLLAVLGALLLLNLGFYLFLNLPRLRALDDLSSGRNVVRRALVATSRVRDALREQTTRYDEEIVRLKEFYDERLGSQSERMTAIQKKVREIAAEFRVDPDSIDYNSDAVEGTDLTRFQITIPLVGGYPNLRQFINLVESSPRMFIVDSIELAGAREGGAMLSLTIRISTYFKSPESERAGPSPRPGRSRT